MKNKLWLILLLLLGTLAISACNTLQGAGKDIQSAGKALENAVDDDDDDDNDL